MDISEQLDELEERLEAVCEALEGGNYNEARDHAKQISGIIDCALCENLEAGVLGGVMFAAGIDQRNQEQRAEMVAQEVRNFIETDLQGARERLAEREGVPDALQT